MSPVRRDLGRSAALRASTAGDRRYRVVETRGRTWHSGASRAGQLIAERVGEVIAQRGLKHARVRLEIERCDADPVGTQVQPLALPARTATTP